MLSSTVEGQCFTLLPYSGKHASGKELRVHGSAHACACFVLFSGILQNRLMC